MLTLSEQILYSTTNLKALKNNSVIGTGTGFFFKFATDDNKWFPAIVTNKHVATGCDAIAINLHIAEDGKPSGRITSYMIEISDIVNHPSQNVDLCAIMIGNAVHHAGENGNPIFAIYLSPDVLPKDDYWEYFDAIEEIIMVGCPRGIFDETHNTPITRKGITATPISKKYNGKNEFMVDMACFPGSSGSPIFIYNKGSYYDKKTNTTNFGSDRILLVGVLYAGPLITNTGEIVLSNLPKVSINSTMHLGYVIRASELLILDEEVRRRVSPGS